MCIGAAQYLAHDVSDFSTYAWTSIVPLLQRACAYMPPAISNTMVYNRSLMNGREPNGIEYDFRAFNCIQISLTFLTGISVSTISNPLRLG